MFTADSREDGDTSQRQLADPKLKKLEALIRRSFRVRDNRTPIYVDVSDNLQRISLDQHQVVFGRRGSGKSCLLIYFRREVAPDLKVPTIYVSADTIKTLDYPDVLIRLLLAIFENLPSQRWWHRTRRWITRTTSDVDEVITELRGLLLSLRPRNSRSLRVERDLKPPVRTWEWTPRVLMPV